MFFFFIYYFDEQNINDESRYEIEMQFTNTELLYKCKVDLNWIDKQSRRHIIYKKENCKEYQNSYCKISIFIVRKNHLFKFRSLLISS